MTALEVFEALGGQLVQPKMLIDAMVPLNLSGEAVRGRICTFVDAAGHEWALRPDLTLPVALAEIERRRGGHDGAQSWCYSGSVFRLPALPGEPVEYTQIGLERFGYPSGTAADLDLVNALISATRAEGISSAVARFGDLSIFPAFVDALQLNPPVASAIKRAFRQAGGVRAYFAGQQSPETRRGLSARLSGLPRAEVQDFVEDVFALTGLQPIGERTTEEIVERLYQKQSETLEPALNDSVQALLLAVLAIDVPLADATSQLRDIASNADLKGLDTTLAKFEERSRYLLQDSVTEFVTEARFATRFGRRFTYYDGFVFELAKSFESEHAVRPFAAGGRYDALLAKLSDAELSGTAIGGVVIPHRIAAAQETQHD